MLKTVLIAAGVALLLFAAVTLVALEGGEVVVIQTADAAGKARRTRTWVADDGGATFIEAANGERPFLRDLRENPDVALERGGAWRRCRAAAAENPAGHRRIRTLLAAKYGWKDHWIGLLTDTSGSLAVRLACE